MKKKNKNKMTQQQIVRECNENLTKLFYSISDDLVFFLDGEAKCCALYSSFICLEVPENIMDALENRRAAYRKIYSYLKRITVDGERYELTIDVYCGKRRFVLSNSNIS